MSDASTNYSETPNSSPDDLLTTVQAALEKHGPGSDIGPMRALGWLRALVAEVERLREQRNDAEHDADTTKAALAALREQRCETCRHSVRYTDNGSLYCYVLRNALNDVPCQLVGYRCGAWARREP